MVCEVEILKRAWALLRTGFYQTPNAQTFDRESVPGSKFLAQKENIPDHQLRSLIFA